MTEKVDLTAEQLQQIRDAFQVFDKDKDGKITSKELGIVLRSLGQNPTENELQQLINEWDEDGTGAVEFPEFVQLMARRLREEEKEEELREFYAVFDRERKGYVASGDLRNVFEHLGDAVTREEIDELMAELDKDGDGRITYEEYNSMIMKKKS